MKYTSVIKDELRYSILHILKILFIRQRYKTLVGNTTLTINTFHNQLIKYIFWKFSSNYYTEFIVNYKGFFPSLLIELNYFNYLISIYQPVGTLFELEPSEVHLRWVWVLASQRIVARTTPFFVYSSVSTPPPPPPHEISLWSWFSCSLSNLTLMENWRARKLYSVLVLFFIFFINYDGREVFPYKQKD